MRQAGINILHTKKNNAELTDKDRAAEAPNRVRAAPKAREAERANIFQMEVD